MVPPRNRRRTKIETRILSLESYPGGRFRRAVATRGATRYTVSVAHLADDDGPIWFVVTRVETGDKQVSGHWYPPLGVCAFERACGTAAGWLFRRLADGEVVVEADR